MGERASRAADRQRQPSMTNPANAKAPGLWVGQPLHYACLAPLLALVWAAWRFLGEPFPAAFWTAIAIPYMHHTYVWLAWRLELRSSATSGTIGFRAYRAFFFVLFGGRFISLLLLGWLDRGSLGLQPVPWAVLTTLLVLIGIYATYSVLRYFGLTRAVGADHFDPRYRTMSFVKEGIFKFTSNAMYVFGFLSFWAVAVALNSAAALVVAVFSHAYIWVHYHATEKPDMRFIYSQASDSSSG